MKLGICLPHESFAMAGETPEVSETIRLARLAEELGFHSVWIVDHFCYVPYEDQQELGITIGDDLKDVPFGAWECWTLSAAVASVTSRVEIGTLVTNTGYRNPALLAVTAETVDALSGGRLILGVGAGDFPSEHERFGYPWERRVGRFEEALQIVKPMMRGETVSFDGEFYQVKDAHIVMRGPRHEGAPILIGVLGRGPRMRRLVAQYADHWNCWMGFTDNRAPAYVELRDAMHAACEKHGRDPATLVKNASVRICPTGEPPWVPGTHPIMGSPREIADQLNQFAELGVTHINTFMNPNNQRGLEALAPALEYLD